MRVRVSPAAQKIMILPNGKVFVFPVLFSLEVDMFDSIRKHPGEAILVCRLAETKCLWAGILDANESLLQYEAGVIPTSRHVKAPGLMAHDVSVCLGGIVVTPAPDVVCVGNRAVSGWLKEKDGTYPYLCEIIQSLLGPLVEV